MTNEKLTLLSLFIFRFVTDKADDIVDLRQDVKDLHFYPERLMGSYTQEWLTYVKKRTYELNYDLTSDVAQTLFSQLSVSEQKEFYSLWQIIEKAEQISNSDNVDVIKTDVKAYVEQLLKL